MALNNFPKLFLGPMAELSTPPFRKEVRRFSSKTVLFSEMLSAGSVNRGGFKNKLLEYRNDNDDPFIYQLLGNSPKDLSTACSILSERNPYAIDLNMGCSAPDISKKNMGSKLLLPEYFNTVKNIIHDCRTNTQTKLSVKMRLGYQEYNINYLKDFTLMLQDEGIDFITIHGRIGKQAFRRSSLTEPAKKITNHLKIPAIYNGDISTPEKGLSLLKSNSFSSIMISRGAVSTPWCFGAIENGLEGKDFSVDILPTAQNILKDINSFYPEDFHKSRSLRFCAYFVKNFKFGHNLFSKIRQETNPLIMLNIIEEYLDKNPQEKIKNYIFNKD